MINNTSCKVIWNLWQPWNTEHPTFTNALEGTQYITASTFVHTSCSSALAAAATTLWPPIGRLKPLPFYSLTLRKTFRNAYSAFGQYLLMLLRSTYEPTTYFVLPYSLVNTLLFLASSYNSLIIPALFLRFLDNLLPEVPNCRGCSSAVTYACSPLGAAPRLPPASFAPHLAVVEAPRERAAKRSTSEKSTCTGSSPTTL